jgi:hypothetical protein
MILRRSEPGEEFGPGTLVRVASGCCQSAVVAQAGTRGGSRCSECGGPCEAVTYVLADEDHVSACCGAEAVVCGFTTRYWACTRCRTPCDVKISEIQHSPKGGKKK